MLDTESTLQIFPNSAKNKAIESYVDDALLRLRNPSAPEKIKPRDIKLATRSVDEPPLLVALCDDQTAALKEVLTELKIAPKLDEEKFNFQYMQTPFYSSTWERKS